MKKEELLKIWMDSNPSAKSPKELYGCPPMWETLVDGDLTLFTRPGKTMARPAPLAPYVEVDGVHYQWQRDGEWVGQGCQATFADFEAAGAAKIDIPEARIGFDWSKRVSFPVLTLPFIEGMPSKEKAKDLSLWIKSKADRYKNFYLKMYHGTAASLPIEQEGLKPTSLTRRRSYQSSSGFVYLANTPERAKVFGDIGNGGNSLVYEVVVPIRSLLADKDQLNNQRSVGIDVGDSVGESIVYGGGLRVRGAIEPWAVRQFDIESEIEATRVLVERAERERRFSVLSALKNKSGTEYTLWTIAQRTARTSDPHRVNWQEVENTVIAEAIGKNGQPPELVAEVLRRYSPGAVSFSDIDTIGQRVMAWTANVEGTTRTPAATPKCSI